MRGRTKENISETSRTIASRKDDAGGGNGERRRRTTQAEENAGWRRKTTRRAQGEDEEEDEAKRRKVEEAAAEADDEETRDPPTPQDAAGDDAEDAVAEDGQGEAGGRGRKGRRGKNEARGEGGCEEAEEELVAVEGLSLTDAAVDEVTESGKKRSGPSGGGGKRGWPWPRLCVLHYRTSGTEWMPRVEGRE